MPSIHEFQNPLYNNGFIEAIRACDYYGKPISMTFESRQSHQTVFGAIVTIAVFVSFSVMFTKSMLSPELFYH